MLFDARTAPRAVLIADQVARNVAMAFPPVARWRVRRGRTSASEIGSAQLKRYAYDPFDLLVQSVGRLDGLAIGEIGPGDHVPVSLLALAAGAEKYQAFDRFAGEVDGPRAKAFYRALLEDLRETRPELSEQLRQRAITVDSLVPGGFLEHVPLAVESLPVSKTLDVLFSYNAVEHFSDLEPFCRRTFGILKPGAVAVHQVDYSAHDCWRQRPPLEWLAIPDWAWRIQGSHRGTPNRWRHHEVLAGLIDAGFDVSYTIQHGLNETEVKTWKTRLAPKFRSMPLESLVVQSAVYVCRVPR